MILFSAAFFSLQMCLSPYIPCSSTLGTGLLRIWEQDVGKL